MQFLKNIIRRSQKNLLFKIEDPTSFREVWSFSSNGLRVISLILLLLILFSLLILFLFGNLFVDWRGEGNISIERKKLERQAEEIRKLNQKATNQEKYIQSFRLILNNEIPVSNDPDSLVDRAVRLKDSIRLNQKDHAEEIKKASELARKVRNDNKPKTNDKAMASSGFMQPVKGIISQTFDRKSHPGIDLVTTKDAMVKCAASGSVIYAGYTRKDGYLILIDHDGEFLTVYKHNRAVLKKTGDRVRAGDPIAITGDTGENSDGPHLHFELWLKGNPIDPARFIHFKH